MFDGKYPNLRHPTNHIAGYTYIPTMNPEIAMNLRENPHDIPMTRDAFLE